MKNHFRQKKTIFHIFKNRLIEREKKIEFSDGDEMKTDLKYKSGSLSQHMIIV